MSHPTIDAKRREEAAAWFAAQRRGALSLDEREAFDSWRADAQNQAALDRMHQLWGETSAIKAAGMRVERPGRLRQAGLIAATLLILVLGGVGFSRFFSPLPETRIETAIGEQTTRELPDGSVIAVNVVSRVRYDIDERQRLIELDEGEAAFFVRRDPARPFLVRTGAYEIRALGTVFNVKRRGESLDVSVGEGRVEVVALTGPEAGRVICQLSEGQTLRLSDAVAAYAAAAFAPTSVPTAQVGEWRMRVVTYENASVGEVLADLNRFFERPVAAGAPDLAARRVTLRLEVGDRDRALQTLGDLLGADVVEGGREDVLIPTEP